MKPIHKFDTSTLRKFAKDIIDYPYSRDSITYKGIDYVVSFDYTGDEDDYDDDGRSDLGIVIFTPDPPRHRPYDEKEYSVGWMYSYRTYKGRIIDFDYNTDVLESAE